MSIKKVIALSILLLVAGSAHAAPSSSICRQIATINGRGFIYKQSAPLRSGGVGTPLIGYRKEPTLISNTRGALKSRGNIFAENGTKLGSCPWASAHGHSGRYRCTMQTSGLRRAAIRAARSPAIYFDLNGKRCIKIPDAGRCFGSVKGLCNQLIK